MTIYPNEIKLATIFFALTYYAALRSILFFSSFFYLIRALSRRQRLYLLLNRIPLANALRDREKRHRFAL